MSKKIRQPNLTPQAIQFSQQLTNTGFWIDKADELLTAADILEGEVVQYWAEIGIKDGQVVGTPKRRNIQGPYFLLIAYSLENYLKALLIHRNLRSLKNRLLSSLPDYIKEHNLVQLARRVNLSISVQEEELLSRLSRNSMWAARYPVPTSPDGLAAIKEFSNGKAYLVAYFGPQDVNLIKKFTDRLQKHVMREFPNSHNKTLNPTG